MLFRNLTAWLLIAVRVVPVLPNFGWSPYCLLQPYTLKRRNEFHIMCLQQGNLGAKPVHPCDEVGSDSILPLKISAQPQSLKF
jgi:hypothetical protein